jgi:hypothetical protein
MDRKHDLYVMISRTDTGMGKIIRYFTDYPYNHVSLSLDPNLDEWVSFARYARDVPLAGGFVRENADRFFASGGSIHVRIYRLEISEIRFRILRNVFAQAGKPDCGLIYNSFGALASGLNMQFPVSGAYTCLEFANAVLEQSHCTIRQLADRLEPHLIYEGELMALISGPGKWAGDYFVPRSHSAAVRETTLHFARLLRRTVSPGRFDPAI